MMQLTGTDDPDVTTRFRYNDQGQCTDLISADAVEHYEYDIMGNRYCSTISLPTGKIISKTYTRYDLNNAVIWRQGQDVNNTLLLYYNAAGLLQASRQSLIRANASTMEPACAAYTLYEYDACGRLIEEVDPLGNCTYRDYDSLGRVLHITKEGLTTTYSYEAGGLVASVTSPSGATTSRSYTTNGLPITEAYPDGTTTSCIYDFFGRPIQEINNNIVRSIHYDDAAHQVIRSQGELTEVETFDVRGNLICRIDPAGHEWKKTYDGLNRLKTETTPSGDTTTWNYCGNTITCTLPSGEQVIQRYEAGALVENQILDPQGTLIACTRYERYPDQNMIQEIRGDNVTITWMNTLGLPIRIQQGNLTTTHTYDPAGNCIASIDGDGRLIQEEISLNGKTIQQTQQSWTPSTRTLQIGNHQREFQYQAGQLKNLTSNGFRLSYDYGLNGQLCCKTSPLSSTNIHYNVSGLPEAVHVQFSNDAYQEKLEWTNSGKLLTHGTTYPNHSRTDYKYNARGYLQAANDLSYTFDFDQAGRGIRTAAPNWEVPNNGLDPFGKTLIEGRDSQAVSFIHDAMGQVIAHGDNQLSWDPWGRLIAVTNDTYSWKATYDAFGRRLQTCYTSLNNKERSILTTSFFDPEEEFQEVGINCNGKTFWKLCKDTSCDAIIDEKGNIATLIHDIQGNLAAVMTSQEVVWNQDQPSPYGSLATQSLKPDLLSVAQAHAWQSKRADPTNFVWLGARYYFPRSGRFLSSDPVGHPACLDLYAYANGDPINNIDPNGRYASYAYQSLGSFVIDSYSSLKSNFNEFSQGYKIGNSLSFEEMRSKNPWSTNSSLSYGMGESYGRMEASLRQTLEMLSPARPDGMVIGELPFSGGFGRSFSRTITTKKTTQITNFLFQPSVAELPATSSVSAYLLKNKLIAEEISGGHAFMKHVIKKHEFPGFSQSQFEQHLRNVLNNPTEMKTLSRGRVGYWHQESGTVIIRDPLAKDGGTAFRPIQGEKYFQDVLK